MPVLAALFSTVMFVLGWAVSAATMYGIGWLAWRAGGEPGLLHIGAMWILGPGVGAYLAVTGTSSVFRSVSPHTIFVGVNWLIGLMTIIAATGFMIGSTNRGSSAFLPFLLAAAQCASAVIGAMIGYSIQRSSKP